ncbi:50S ribosomal protein L37e [Candidatus Woesearchaeota archaeon]|nr:50S ribosomal protein L37e [Candidatus Woesearchaeota archaeon]
MTKGTESHGKKSGKKTHIVCRRCGNRTYHCRDKICSSCNYGKSPRMRSYAWQKY